MLTRLGRWLARGEIAELEALLQRTGSAVVQLQERNRDLRGRLASAKLAGCPDRPTCARLAHELEQYKTKARAGG